MSESDRLAREATTQGEWFDDGREVACIVNGRMCSVAIPTYPNDAAFIAYHSPAYILALNERGRLLEAACAANIAWFDAENECPAVSTTFYERVDMCRYSEWISRKALGQDVGEYKGVPRIVLSRPAALDALKEAEDEPE